MHVKLLLLSALLIVLLPFAGQAKESKWDGGKYYLSLNLGLWSNSGGSPIKIAYNELDSSDFFETDFSETSFYLEGTFGYRLIKTGYLELALGTVNRGSVNFVENGLGDFSNVLLYPIQLQFKFYPLLITSSRFQPYAGIGGAVYYARRTIQLTQNYYFYNLQGETKTDFNYVVSGGAEWYLSQHTGLDFKLSYLPISFSEEFITIKDYSAVSVTVGFKYRYGKK